MINFRQSLLLLVLTVSALTLSAQESGVVRQGELNIDSLTTLLKTQGEDTNKVKTLNELSKGLARSQPDRAVNFGKSAKELALKLGYIKGQAFAYKNVGLSYYGLGKYTEALIEWSESLKLFIKLNDKLGEANLLNNIGAIYADKGDYIKSLDHYLESLKLSEELKDSLRIATALNNIGSVYEKDPTTYSKAITFYKRAIVISDAINDYDLIGLSSQNIGQIYLTMKKYDDALESFMTSKAAYETMFEQNYLTVTLGFLGKVYALKGDFNKAKQFHDQSISISRKYGYKIRLAQSLIKLAETYEIFNHHEDAIRNYLEAEQIAKEAGAKSDLMLVYEGLSNIYGKINDFKSAYKYQSMFIAIRNELYKEDTAKQLQKLQFGFDLEKKESQIVLLTKDKELKDLEIANQQVTRNALLGGVAFLGLLAFFLYTNYKQKDKTSKMLSRQNAEITSQKEEIQSQRDDIESQKAEIEKLILNILPVEVAQELRKTGRATPRYYESVTVLFTDFKEFTRIAEALSAQDLVADLNECFIAFDKIIEEFGLEKIKTIGDAYMCACGIPSEVRDHPAKAVRAALAIQKYIQDENVKRKERGAAVWELRIGIHTGPVIAGVVGRKKFAYDIWGNAVNLASRLETNGKEGKVNISETTYHLVKDQFECVYRGKIFAKNIGDVDMYFVEKELVAENISNQISSL